ncbi:endosome-associated-trafficking regulator 1 isoform X2 [Ambystoma mexicanum]|uniref:endosome-associated-trafficking regulator 1 isoform X2 n=1 Tax=Ambystoma mexicanum TaxID=8296 RepID=UPI0037E8FC24
MSSSYDFRTDAVQSTRPKTVIAQDGDQTGGDETNPFSFKQFVKSQNLPTPVDRSEKYKVSKSHKHYNDRRSRERRRFHAKRNPEDSATQKALPETATPPMKGLNIEFHKPFFGHLTIDSLLDAEEGELEEEEEEEDSDDDWDGSYQPAFVEQAQNKPGHTIPIKRNNFDSFSLTSADLSDVPAWQLNDSKEFGSLLPDASQGTTDSSSSLTDASHESTNSNPPLPDVSHATIEYSSLLPDVSLEAEDYNALLPDVFHESASFSSAGPDVSFGSADHSSPSLDVHSRSSDPDTIAHGDVSRDLRIQSLQLKEENSQLVTKMEDMRKINEARAEKIRTLEKKLTEKQMQEEKEAKALESMAQQVELNLKTMTMRAIRAENIVARLKEDVVLLQVQLANCQVDNATLRHMENVNLHAAKRNAQMALENLHKVIYDAQSSIQQLLSGGEKLKFVTELLKSIDKITEMRQEDCP